MVRDISVPGSTQQELRRMRRLHHQAIRSREPLRSNRAAVAAIIQSGDRSTLGSGLIASRVRVLPALKQAGRPHTNQGRARTTAAVALTPPAPPAATRRFCAAPI
jgi:hypothetical protein